HRYKHQIYLTTPGASDPLSPLLGTDMALGVGENIRRPHLSLRTRKGLRCLQITSAESGRALPLPFSSPLSFFLDFWWNFQTPMRREWGVGSLYKGGYPG